jgi:antitoxin FitA
MPTLQVRDVPEEIYRNLVRQAEEERRSLAQQAIVVLAKGLEVEVDPRIRRKRVLEEIKKANLGKGLEHVDFVKMIREDRDR